MSPAQHIEELILLSELACVPTPRVVEDESGFLQDGNLVAIFELSAFVPADDGVVDKSAIDREIFYNCNKVSSPVFVEYQTMAVGYRGELDPEIYSSRWLAMDH